MKAMADRATIWASRMTVLAQERMVADGEVKADLDQEWADLCSSLVREEKRFPGLLEAVEDQMNNKTLTLYC